MSMTIEEISGMLTRAQVENMIDKDGDVVAVLPTENYVNPQGEKALALYFSLRHFQGFGQIFALQTAQPLFDTKGSAHRDALLKLCALLQSDPDPVQFIYLPSAKIIARIEIPLADNKLTHNQLILSLEIFRLVVDRYYEDFKNTLETGVLALSEEVREHIAKAEGNPEFTRL